MPTRAALDEAEASRLIESVCPDLVPARACCAGEGFDFEIYRVGELAFRFPKRREHAARLRNELALLDLVASRASIAVPRIGGGPFTSAKFPWEFAALRWIRGRLMVLEDSRDWDLDALGESFGSFLSEMHSIPLVEVCEACPQIPRGIRDVISWPTRHQDKISRMRGIANAGLAHRLESYAENPGTLLAPLSDDELVFCHGDLHAENIVLEIETRRVAGVIDFGDACIGDCASDFAGLFAWGGDALLDAALRTYGRDAEAIRQRARHLGIWFAVVAISQYNQQDAKRDYVPALLRTLDDTLPVV